MNANRYMIDGVKVDFSDPKETRFWSNGVEVGKLMPHDGLIVFYGDYLRDTSEMYFALKNILEQALVYGGIPEMDYIAGTAKEVLMKHYPELIKSMCENTGGGGGVDESNR